MLIGTNLKLDTDKITLTESIYALELKIAKLNTQIITSITIASMTIAGSYAVIQGIGYIYTTFVK